MAFLPVITGIIRFIFARKVFFRVNTLLFHISLRGMGILNYENTQASGEDHLLKTLQQTHPKIIIEVGAHNGSETVKMAQIFEKTKIFSFEPHPSHFSHLKKNAMPYQNVYVLNTGFGEKKATLFLWDHASNKKGTEHATLYKEAIRDIYHDKAKSHRVKITTLDDFSTKQKLTHIDYLKIDTEGHELSILKGAHKLIQNQSIDFIQLEFNNLHSISRTFVTDFYQILPGYKWYRLLPNGFVPMDSLDVTLTEIFAYQNLLAVSPRALNVAQ